MTHTYRTTNRRHQQSHDLSFVVEALTLLPIIGAFAVHWIMGIISIFPMFLLNGYLKYLICARATYVYLRRDCGIEISWEEAKRYEHYFSPNKTGYWINAERLALLPQQMRRDALFKAIADFDAAHKKSSVPAATGVSSLQSTEAQTSRPTARKTKQPPKREHDDRDRETIDTV